MFQERKRKRPTQNRLPKAHSAESDSMQEEDSSGEASPTFEVTQHSRSLAQLQGDANAKIGEFFNNLSVKVRFESSYVI